MEILSKFSSRERIFLYAAIVFVSCIFLAGALIFPVLEKFRQLNEEILIQEKLLARNVRNLLQKDKVVAEHKQFENYSIVVGSYEEEMAKFLGAVEGYARESQVYLVNIKPHPVIEMDFCKKYAIEVNSQGEMKGLISFLYKIESSGAFMNIEKLQLSAKKAGSPVVEGVMVINKILIP